MVIKSWRSRFMSLLLANRALIENAFNIENLNADIWLDSKDIAGIGVPEIETKNITQWINKGIVSGQFAQRSSFGTPNVYVDGTYNRIMSYSSQSLEYAVPVAYQSVNYQEGYLVIDTKNSNFYGVLYSFRNSSNPLIQLTYTFGSRQLLLQVRTNIGAIQTYYLDMSVLRRNIIHYIIDFSNNRILFEVDNRISDNSYTFGSETIISEKIILFSYYSTSDAADGIGIYEMLTFFSEKLTNTQRINIYNYLNKKYNSEDFLRLSTYTTFSDYNSEIPVSTDYFDKQDVYDMVTSGQITLHEIGTTDNPQTIFDNANPGDLCRFLVGTHIKSLGSNNSILYIDKPMYIELVSGCTLKLANSQNTFRYTGELVLNQGLEKSLDDFSYQGSYYTDTLSNIFIAIDGEGTPDTFKWGVDPGGSPVYTTFGVSITGGWQTLGTTGIQIKFDATTGHSLDSLWILVFDGTQELGIRIGNGTQESYIDNVVIFGDGTIDMNDLNQYPCSIHAKNLHSNILINGRVSNAIISGLTLENGHRPIMVYGESDGDYLFNGWVENSTKSFDVKKVTLLDLDINNNFVTGSQGFAINFGHPEHRGSISGVKIFNCNIDCYDVGIECNHFLFDYEINNNYVRNVVLPTGDIARWRDSKCGIIANNNATATYDSAPGGWEHSKNIYTYGNVRS